MQFRAIKIRRSSFDPVIGIYYYYVNILLRALGGIARAAVLEESMGGRGFLMTQFLKELSSHHRTILGVSP